MVPSVVTLKTAGDTLTMHVQTCELARVGKYPEVEFIGTDVEGRLIKLAVPKQSTERQFGRIGLDYAGAVGKTLTFSRDPNASDPAKPYWGITVDNVAAISTARPNGNASKAKQGINLGSIPGLDDEPPPPDDAPPAPAPVDPAKARLAGIFKLQEVCFTHALKLAKHAHDTSGVPLTLEGISALTAQALIAAKN